MKKFVHDLIILDKQVINQEYFTLSLTHEELLPTIMPAQFVEVLVENAHSVFLRRPISIHDVDYDDNVLKLLIQVVGEGTSKLLELNKGDLLNLVYPLGNSFSTPENTEILLIGGGCGMAPLLYTARYFKNFGFKPTILLGTRNKNGIILREEYSKYGELLVCTEDGSLGTKGFVTDHPILKENRFKEVYACGPTPMLKAIGNWAIKNDIKCEVSLENLMACGVGACLCCVQKTKQGNKTVCQDGPVFNIKDIIW